MNGYAFGSPRAGVAYIPWIFACLGRTTTSWSGPSRLAVRWRRWSGTASHRAAVTPKMLWKHLQLPSDTQIRLGECSEDVPAPWSLHRQFRVPCSNLIMIKLGAHQIQASAPASSSRTVSGYAAKSSMMMTLSFGLLVTLSGRLRRDSTATEVMDGLFRHWWRVSEPTKPVAPANITFIAQSSSGVEGNKRSFADWRS